MGESIRVLIVDDNEAYRRAFRRNLALQKFEVAEAANAELALQALQEHPPDVLITDLQMRTRTEGLDLIREARLRDPLLPIIMISAVGTFEEGAAASQMGALHVVAKSNIENEIGRLHEMIRVAHAGRARAEGLIGEMEAIRSDEDPRRGAARLREILSEENVAVFVKGEAYDLLIELTGEDFQARSRATVGDALSGEVGRALLHEVDAILAEALPHLHAMTPEALEALRTAEFLYQQENRVEGRIDLSRSIGFSYCFAVESEAKANLGRRIHRLVQNPQVFEILHQVIEGPERRLGVFFHQAILQALRGHAIELTAENVRQTLLRILEFRGKYKPDGLKAIAVVVLCFGRSYEVRTARSSVSTPDLLGLKGLGDESEVLLLCRRLAQLQHYRNPYIHPEINEREKIPAIRQETLDCLRMIGRLA